MIPNTHEKPVKSLRLNGRLMLLDEPRIMGILNLTADSFHAGSRVDGRDELLRRVATMLEDGADIIDLGAQSTRPGARRISASDEAALLIPAIQSVILEFPGIVLSADTFYGEVARRAVDAGAAMINDVSAWQIDETMFSAITDLHVPYVLMHMQGVPETMQQNPVYDNVVGDVILFLSGKYDQLRQAGVADVILDPGFGFGKSLDQNIELFRGSASLSILDLPMLAGISRKKTLQQIAGTDAAHALNATTAAHMLALDQGFHILRVHDVREAREAIQIRKALRG